MIWGWFLMGAEQVGRWFVRAVRWGCLASAAVVPVFLLFLGRAEQDPLLVWAGLSAGVTAATALRLADRLAQLRAVTADLKVELSEALKENALVRRTQAMRLHGAAEPGCPIEVHVPLLHDLGADGWRVPVLALRWQPVGTPILHDRQRYTVVSHDEAGYPIVCPS